MDDWTLGSITKIIPSFQDIDIATAKTWSLFSHILNFGVNMTSKLCCLSASWTPGRDVLIASLPLLFWQLFSWKLLPKLHRYESVNKPNRFISYLVDTLFFRETRIPMISEKGFLTWKGNILLFWVKLAGLSKCIHISALTAWSTNKKRQQQNLMKYKTEIKCITTYVSSLLVVRTVVPTGKKKVRKRDEQIKQL